MSDGSHENPPVDFVGSSLFEHNAVNSAIVNLRASAAATDRAAQGFSGKISQARFLSQGFSGKVSPAKKSPALDDNASSGHQRTEFILFGRKGQGERRYT